MPYQVHRLSERLRESNALPKPASVPELSYGRHRGPAPPNARLAAVAVTLFQAGGNWFIPLTLRPKSLQHHGGQVCFPGGRVESGETTLEAALREFHEELGVPARVQHPCGELSTQYVYASRNLVHPIVAIIEEPAPWDPDPSEVEQVISLPLSVLADRRHQVLVTQQRRVESGAKSIDHFTFRAPAYEFEDHLIWGATALILDQLAQILLADE